MGRVEAVVAAGVGLLQLRQKRGVTADRRAWLAEFRQRLPAETLLIVNDDLDAVTDPHGRVLADGVHLGRDDVRTLGQGDLVRGLREARRRIGADALLGSSTRSLTEVRAAVEGGVDHVGFGAMADSPTKSGTTRADPTELRRCAEAFPALPIFPIGGLDPRNLHMVSDAGVRRAALGSALLEAAEPATAANTVLAWSRG
jgi:thiamine-phosphate pyrophosphorylase